MWRRLSVVGIGLLFCGLVTHRVWRYSTYEDRRRMQEMPREVADTQERDLFLFPGGPYTVADIAANGGALPSQKFRRLRIRHDYKPLPGDRLCPVTLTKANRECTWIIGGREYQFCCPPFIAEFVRLAKEKPQQIEPPEAYIRQ